MEVRPKWEGRYRGIEERRNGSYVLETTQGNWLPVLGIFLIFKFAFLCDSREQVESGDRGVLPLLFLYSLKVGIFCRKGENAPSPNWWSMKSNILTLFWKWENLIYIKEYKNHHGSSPWFRFIITIGLWSWFDLKSNMACCHGRLYNYHRDSAMFWY